MTQRKISPPPLQLARRGFSLIELLAVVVITALLGLVTVQILLTSQLRGSETDITGRLRQEGNFLMDQISFEIRNARDVQCVSPTQLSVSSKDNGLLIYNLSGTSIASNGSQLTSTDVAVSSLLFTCQPDVSTAGALVTISFTLTPTKGDPTLKQDFMTSAYARSH